MHSNFQKSPSDKLKIKKKIFGPAGPLLPANLLDPVHRFLKPLHRSRVREPDPAGRIERAARGCRYVALFEPLCRDLGIVTGNFYKRIESAVGRGAGIAHLPELCEDVLAPLVKLGAHLFNAFLVAL